MNEVEFDDEEYEDIENLIDGIKKTVVYASDWTVETIINQVKRNNIDINPRFQRRDAWNIAKKTKYIESLMVGVPVPQIVLAEKKGCRGKFIVLDGRQRLLSLMQFMGIEKNEGYDDSKSGFKLNGCEIRTELNGKNYSSIESDVAYEELLNTFYNQTIRSVVIRECPNSRILELIFVRLNTGSVQLSPSELRLALKPGEFMYYVDQKACECDLLHKLLGFSGHPDFRMRDNELLTRFYSFKLFLQDYKGKLSEFIDDCTDRMNTSWDGYKDKVEYLYENFEKGLEVLFKIFGDNLCRKWVENKYEKSFNRALLDAMIYYFSESEVRNAAKNNEEKIEQAFKDLCAKNEDFLEALGVSTKKTEYVARRIALWGVTLNKVLDINLSIPKCQDGRIQI